MRRAAVVIAAAGLAGAAMAGCGGAPAAPATPPAPVSDTIVWSITSPTGTARALMGGGPTGPAVAFPLVDLPYTQTTTAPRGQTAQLELTATVFNGDSATCTITVNGSVVATDTTSDYRTPAACRWG